MTQAEINALSDAFRSQGLTWSQTNFAVSVVRNSVALERKWAARVCEKQMPNPVSNWADAQIVEALRLAAETIRAGRVGADINALATLSA